jgi:DNA-binding NarL/FixJ family response regulator
LSRTSVLIVDDHEAFRRTLRMRFEAMPEFVVCAEAADGVEAVEKAQQLAPDLVILDFAMPEMHGLDAATAIKFILPRARIYLLTAHSSRDLELAARNGGVDAVFSKYDNLTAMFKQAKVGRIFKDADESHAKSTSIERSPNTSSDGKSSIH